jgi:hypothetical protein
MALGDIFSDEACERLRERGAISEHPIEYLEIWNFEVSRIDLICRSFRGFGPDLIVDP